MYYKTTRRIVMIIMITMIMIMIIILIIIVMIIIIIITIMNIMIMNIMITMMIYVILIMLITIRHANTQLLLHSVSVRRFPSFRTQPLESLSHYLRTNIFLSNPAPGENILGGNRVMETGCSII